jgi:hypothetical protein
VAPLTYRAFVRARLSDAQGQTGNGTCRNRGEKLQVHGLNEGS